MCVLESVYLNFGYRNCITDIISEQTGILFYIMVSGFSLCEFVSLCWWGKPADLQRGPASHASRLRSLQVMSLARSLNTLPCVKQAKRLQRVGGDVLQAGPKAAKTRS